MVKLKKAQGKNQQGSVLLAVVCMSMICLMLVSIALAYVNQTTKRSSANVQKAQAKVTAEAALTEFVSQYYADNYDAETNDDPYAELETVATGNSFDTGYQITVDTSSLNEQLGECKMSIYNFEDGYKVAVQCTYGEETQTASAYFGTKSTSTPTTSAAIESANGVNISEGSVNGDLYVDKGTSDYTYFSTTNSAYYRSHIYSEISIFLNAGTKVRDETNKTKTSQFDHDTVYFQQASTITSEGYLYTKDGCSIYTTVGKTDVNGKNGDDADYDSSNLSNKDGYIYTMKKLILTYNGSCLDIGDSTNPIDVYCRGAYIGSLPQTINGTATDYATIITAFSKDQNSSSVTPNTYTDGTFTVNGNFYSYKKTTNASDGAVSDGNVVIGSGSHPFTVNGDMFVDGDIYLLGGSTLTVTGTLHCTGTIYIGSYDGTAATTSASSTISGGALTNSVLSSSVSAGALSNDIDYTVERNNIPDEGYDPATGTTSSTGRQSTTSKYENSTSNMMFYYSNNGTTEQQKKAANISSKYADAIETTSDDTSAVEYIGTYNSSRTYKINESVRLRSSNDGLTATNNNDIRNYIVTLTDSDIVVALPLNVGLTSAFRIDRSQVPDGESYFCYFMFYDESNPYVCYYSTEIQSDTSVSFTLTRTDGTSSGPYTTADSSAISSAYINFGGANYAYQVADFALIAEYIGSGDEINDPYDVSNYSTDIAANFNATGYNNLMYRTDSSLFQNYIMYLVPDSVSFSIGASGKGHIQGVVFAPKSTVTLQGGGSNYYVYGQVKAGYFVCGEATNSDTGGMVFDIPIADGSIFEFVEYMNTSNSGSSEGMTLQYYEY